MKYAFMSFSCPELEFNQILDISKIYGYEGFEPRTGIGHRHGIEIDASKQLLKEIKERAAESGISICCIATSCKFSNPADVRQNIDEAKRCIELAAEVSSPLIRVFGGAIPDDVDRNRSRDLITGALSELSDFALHRGVIICLETHDDWAEPEEAAEVVRRVAHPAIAINWDIMHPVLIGKITIEMAYETLKPWIRHVHVHDGVKTEKAFEFRVIGKGMVDHKNAIKLLKRSGYEGYISGEWINWDPYEVHLPREIAIMKEYEKQDSGGCFSGKHKDYI